MQNKRFSKLILIVLFCFIFIVGCSDNTQNKVEHSNTAIASQSSDSNNNIEIISTKEAELHFINTGNSDSILIIQGDKAALIDAGDNDDEQRVVSYIKKQGVTELEYVFATHPHSDHIGGLDAVVNSIPIKNIFVSNGDADTKTYSDFINAMANKGLYPSVPLLGSEFKLGSATLKVLSVANVDDPNNNSIVLEFINGNDKALLMGDAEKEIESNLNPGDVDLIKVGHHGSHSSSTLDFLNKVNPEYAVITCGEGNKYGHPHKETMDTLKKMNVEVHRSDECGDIVFNSTGNSFVVNCPQGSYNSGSQQNSSPSDINTKVNDNITQEPDIKTNQNSEIVYWTPNGKSYHTANSCPTLSRSKTILSGTQAESDKSDPCDKCH